MQYGDKLRKLMVSFFRTNRLINKLITFGKQSLVTNAGYLMAISLVNAIVGFIFWGLAARLYSPEGVGYTSAIVSAAFLICGITDFGMSVGLVRFLPETQSPVKFLNTIFSVEVLTSILAGIAYLSGISTLTPSLIALREDSIYIVGFIIYVTFFTLGSLVSRAFIARRKSLYALYFNFISNGSRLIFAVLLVGFGNTGLFTSFAISYFLAALISLIYFLPKIDPGYRFQPSLNWTVLKSILPYSLGNYIVGLLSMISQRLLPLLIIERLGSASSGYFYIAWIIGDFIHSPSSALSDATFAEGSNSPEKLNNYLIRSASIGLGLTVAASIIVGVGAPYILNLFGESYAQEASTLLRWLALAAPLTVINGLYFTNLRVKKQTKLLVFLSAVFAIVTLGIAYLFIPRLGITAVGVSWLAANGLTALGASYGFGWHKSILRFSHNIHRQKETPLARK